MNIKKKMIRILLITILLSLILGYMINEVGAHTVNKINNTTLTGGTQKITIYERDIDLPHLFCVQHGKKIVNGTQYQVGNAVQVQDPKLAYIFAKTNMNTTESYWISGRQIAVWRYLSDNPNSTDTNNILGQGTARIDHDNPVVCNNGSSWRNCAGNPRHRSSGSCIYANAWADSTTILNDAQRYADGVRRCNISISEPVLNGNNITFNITGGTYDYFKIKVNGTEISNSSYSVSGSRVTVNASGISRPLTKVEVIPYKKMYKVEYRLLKNANSQRLLVISSIVENGANYAGPKVEKRLNEITNVSVQKYITKVTKADGSVINNYNNDRKNQKTELNEAAANNVRDEISGRGTNVENKADANSYYKKDQAVEIEIGNKVTYRIDVYNNSNNTANDILIKDKFEWDLQYVSIDSIKDQSGRDIKEQWEKDSAYPTQPTYKYTISSLGAYSTASFYITLEFKQHNPDANIMNNTVWISNTLQRNEKTYRTTDRDYIKIASGYSVSLEKYISKVNDDLIVPYKAEYDINDDGIVNDIDAMLILYHNVGRVTISNGKGDVNGDGRINANDSGVIKNWCISNNTRENKRYNENAINSNNKNLYKIENKVPVQDGDIVTYTIRLKNTGDLPVKVTQIYDSFICMEEGDYNGLKLEFKGAIIGNGNGRVVNLHYGNDSTNSNKTIDRYLIEFNNPIILENTNEFVDVLIQYEVEVPSTISDSSLTLQNKAGIVQIKNENNVIVNDPNIDDNYDMDFVKTSVYSVSLNKFVSAVNNNRLSEDRSTTRYNNNLETQIEYWQNLMNRTTNPEEQEEIREILEELEMNCNPAKHNNPVKLEVGDKVTYTIRLQNTGAIPVKITQIYDSFMVMQDGSSYDGVKLVYDSTYGIRGNGNGRVENLHYDDDTGNRNRTIDRYLIQFNNARLLEPGEYEDVTIQFTVEVPRDKTNIERKLYNIAGIVELRNENNLVVLDSDGDENNRDLDVVETKTYSVSLEKYITQVTYGTNASERRTNARNIEGRDGHPIYEDENYKQPLKTPGPVEVEPGDYVTFVVRVKNTKDTPVRVNIIEDYVTLLTPQCELQYVGQTSIRGTIGNGTSNRAGNTYSISGPSGTNGNKYTLTSTGAQLIGPGEYEDIQLTFEVKLALSRTSSSQTLNNYATIVSTSLSNRNNCGVLDTDGIDNNSDRDWVKTRVYSVGLEKYVSEIKDKNGNIITPPVSDRSGKNMTYKEAHPVELEVGDIVTYTIKLTNTGETSVRIREIEENVTQRDNNNLKLIYAGENQTVRGTRERNQAGSVYTISGPSEINGKKYYTLRSENPVLLAPNTSEVLTLKFEVVVAKSLTVESRTLKNEAKIKEIINRNGQNVADVDGPDNNYDSDWVKTKIYSVSLEKYVSKVTDVNGNNVENITGRENHPIYDDANYKQPLKTPGPVEVEPGDLVTYTIKLTNTNTNPATRTKVKIQQITDNSAQTVNGLELIYKGAGEGSIGFTKNGNIITLDNPPLLEPGQSIYLKLVFEVKVPLALTGESQTLINTAEIVNNSLVNRNNCGVNDSEHADGRGVANNKDSDWVKTKTYAVSLEKYVSKVNGVDVTNINDINRTGKQQYNNNNTEDYKYNNPVTVSKGKKVTYAVTVTNNGNTATKITNLADYLPNGVKYGETSYTNLLYCDSFEHRASVYNASGELVVRYDNGQTQNIINNTNGLEIMPGDRKTWEIEVEVIEPNISLHILKNVAEIISMNNRNNIEVIDTTPNNNKDADYIQLDYNSVDDPSDNSSDDAVLAGNVWNDNALGKGQGNYDAKLNQDEEDKMLEGIDVYLYRVGVNNAIAIATTNENGYYSFGNADIDRTIVTAAHEQYIKGPKEAGTNRWAGSFYSYYVVFEYDGVTYTSTPDGQAFEDIIDSSDYKVDSNASEGNPDGKSGLTNRETFNNRFNPINNTSGINYTTTNQAGYIPESIHNNKDEEGKLLDKYKMQSSTKLIDFEEIFKELLENPFENETEIESRQDKLQYVGLGLRGRDIFDLELTSDVDNIKVTVNGVQGVYKYANKVNLRKSDLTSESTTEEDMANTFREESHTYVDEQGQQIRQQDLDVSTAGTNGDSYAETQEITNIEVTYKITVHNASRTKGTATKVTNYYDNKYTFIKAYSTDESALSASTGSEAGINSVVITTNETILGQAETMEIYVVYRLNTPSTTLGNLDNRLDTYNMSEITEYKTACGEGQTEYTRGLLDKDSAPGSVNKEQVRTEATEGTSTATVDGNPTTVQYYFTGARDIKYEDDTYATPTLYFVKVDSPRVLEGTVFEDLTQINSTTRVKTGNGILDEGEVGVFGATVQLIELNSDGTEKAIRYTTTTDADGKFEFTGYLPGNYIIKYWYGDTKDTVLLNQSSDGINDKSYNGEDFQATNNKYTVDGIETYQLNNTENFWYAINEHEGISTAIDDLDRRKTVSINLTDESNPEKIIELQEKLNRARDGEEIDVGSMDEIGSLVEQTYMYATTDPILLTIEKTEDLNKMPEDIDIVELIDNNLMTIREQDIENNILLGEWAIFPDNSEDSTSPYKEYRIRNMNFGIAEVPVTTLDVVKEISSFIIKDSTGENVLAQAGKDEAGEWNVRIGVVDPAINGYGVQIEDDKLQGARLEVTFDIIGTIISERNFDNTEVGIPAINTLADFVSNNLVYNPTLKVTDTIKNEDYWEIAKYTDGEPAEGSNEINKTWLDPEGKEYTTVLKAKPNNPLLNLGKETDGVYSTVETAKITLEKILSSTDSTIEQIITSTVDTFEYSNIVEILKLDYSMVDTDSDGEVDFAMKDRIRTPERYIIIPGVDHDTSTSDVLSIFPPTGDTTIHIAYYIIAAISLVVLVIGTFKIKKIIVKKQ